MNKMWLLIPLLFIVILVLIHIFFQDRFIFQASTLPNDHVFHFDRPFEEHFIESENGIKINALWFKTTNEPKGLILYFHGNAGNLQGWGAAAGYFTDLEHEVLMVDYRGYGKSEGKPGEKVLYHDARVVWSWLQTQPHPEQVILYGRSLGSAVASYLATEVQPELLILETPIDELKGAVPRLVRPVLKIFPLNHEFPTYKHLQKVTSRKILFHGTEDLIVPISSAEKLKSVLKDGDEFIIIEGAGHYDIGEYDAYRDRIRALLE